MIEPRGAEAIVERARSTERWLDESARPVPAPPAWWTTVDRDLREDIRSGKVEVELEGTASPTGGGQYNRRLASRRIAAVEEVLHSFGVPKIKPQSQGEYDPKTGEETQETKGLDRGKLEESRREMRKVTMKFWQEYKPPGAGSGTAPSGRP